MIDVQSLLEQFTTEDTKQAFSERLGVDTSQAETLLSALTPILTGALANNAKDPQQAEAIAAALDKDHDGSLLQSGMQAVSSTDGAAILQHIFGDKEASVEQKAAQVLGTNSSTVQQAFQVLAPMVMGTLGKVKKEQGLGVSDLADLLQKTKGSSADSLGGKLVTALLDKDNDGSVMDDVLDMGMNAVKNMFSK